MNRCESRCGTTTFADSKPRCAQWREKCGLEVEARRVIALLTEGGAQSPLKKQTVADVAMLRRDGEIKSYIDLFFLAAVVLLCVAKIVTD